MFYRKKCVESLEILQEVNEVIARILSCCPPSRIYQAHPIFLHTRQFSNHMSRLISRSPGFLPHFCWSRMWLYLSVIMPSPQKIHHLHVVIKKLKTKMSMTPTDPTSIEVTCGTYPSIIVSNPHGNTSQCVDTVTIFNKLKIKRSMTPNDLWPHLCWDHMYDSIQVSLCPCPIANKLQYVDKVPKHFQQKVNDPKGSLNDLWPYISWGHMCNSTQGLLCPNTIKIDLSIWI